MHVTLPASSLVVRAKVSATNKAGCLFRQTCVHTQAWRKMQSSLAVVAERKVGRLLNGLNTVKKVGFRSAFIVAYIDGKEVSVSKARSSESKAKEEQKFYQVTVVPSGELDAELSEGIRQQAEGKDIARSETADGKAAYIVGPFGDKGKADSLASFVKAMGEDNVTVSEILN